MEEILQEIEVFFVIFFEVYSNVLNGEEKYSRFHHNVIQCFFPTLTPLFTILSLLIIKVVCFMENDWITGSCFYSNDYYSISWQGKSSIIWISALKLTEKSMSNVYKTLSLKSYKQKIWKLFSERFSQLQMNNPKVRLALWISFS